MEAKNSALLSSCDRYLLESIEWPKGSQGCCGVLRADVGLLSRPCRKRRASSLDDQEISFFSELRRECGLSHELRQGTQGASCVAPGKSNLHSNCEGECGIALDSLQGNPDSRRIEGGISRSFSSCSRKPWDSSNYDGDLREFLIVPIASQEYCGLGTGLSDSTGFDAMEECLISN